MTDKRTKAELVEIVSLQNEETRILRERVATLNKENEAARVRMRTLKGVARHFRDERDRVDAYLSGLLDMQDRTVPKPFVPNRIPARLVAENEQFSESEMKAMMNHAAMHEERDQGAPRRPDVTDPPRYEPSASHLYRYHDDLLPDWEDF